jgi:hypothetical protein
MPTERMRSRNSVGEVLVGGIGHIVGEARSR